MARTTKILLVDDSKFLRLATERALARAGYEVVTAPDGEQAVALARERQPDLIMLDMLLPKMTGLDVLKVLKRTRQRRQSQWSFSPAFRRRMRCACNKIAGALIWKNQSWGWKRVARDCCRR